MKLSKFGLGLAGLASLVAPALTQETEWPILDNGLNEVVQWLDPRQMLLNFAWSDRGL